MLAKLVAIKAIQATKLSQFGFNSSQIVARIQIPQLRLIVKLCIISSLPDCHNVIRVVTDNFNVVPPSILHEPHSGPPSALRSKIKHRPRTQSPKPPAVGKLAYAVSADALPYSPDGFPVIRPHCHGIHHSLYLLAASLPGRTVLDSFYSCRDLRSK